MNKLSLSLETCPVRCSQDVAQRTPLPTAASARPLFLCLPARCVCFACAFYHLCEGRRINQSCTLQYWKRCSGNANFRRALNQMLSRWSCRDLSASRLPERRCRYVCRRQVQLDVFHAAVRPGLPRTSSPQKCLLAFMWALKGFLNCMKLIQ